MIVTALITLLSTFVNGFLATRPPWVFTFPASVVQTMQFLFGMDNIIPVSETCICALASITMFFTMSTTKAGVKVIDWIADVIP